jgi:hypothetical protein
MPQQPEAISLTSAQVARSKARGRGAHQRLGVTVAVQQPAGRGRPEAQPVHRTDAIRAGLGEELFY